MKTKPFIVLVILTAVAMAGAGWSTIERGRATASAAPPPSLFPDLISQVNDIARIDVQTPKLAFTIEKGDGNIWRVRERDGYPVKFETIKQAVVGIASMTMLETKTAKPGLHERLFLKSPKDGGRGTTIALAGGDGKTIAAIVLGKTKSSPSKTEAGIHYVRRLDRDQSYLASSRVEVWETIDRWLDDAMPTVARQRIRAVATVQPNGDRIGVFHTDPDGRDFKIADIPPGMKPLHDTAGNALGSAMGFLDFEDVRKAGRVDFAGANLAEFKTFDGLTVKFLVVKHKDGPKDIFWMQISAAFDAADIQLDGLSDKQREVMKSPDAARTEAADINKRYGPWAFQVPDYKAKDFMTPPDALLVRDDGKSKN